MPPMRWIPAYLLAATLTAAPASSQDRGPGGPGPLLRILDADRDGELSSAELAGATDALKKLDRDGDGALSAGELDVVGRGEGGGPPRGGPRGSAPANSPERPPLARDEAEKKILDVLADLGKTRGDAHVPENDGRLLRLLTEAAKARNVVEIGTSNGTSAIWIGLGLRATGGRLTTHEIDPDRAKTARENFERAGVAELVTVVEGDAHETVRRAKEPIDLLFLDADKPGYLDYLEKLLPLLRAGGLILAHSMNQPRPDPRFVEAITTNPELETLFFHMDRAGMAVTLKKSR